MTTEIIVAPPATGKTSKCIQRIQSMRSNHPLSKIWVIVPDRLQAAAFRKRMADSGGAIGTYVGTFGDLYQFILESSGTYVPVASSTLLHRLVQETVDRSVAQNELTHYTPLQVFPGFILTLRESFAELKRSMIYPEQFLDFTKSGTPAQKDLAVLYARYQSRLQELNWADTEGVSWLAVAALDRQPTIASTIQLLIVDGFDSFNGAQFKALKKLSSQVGDLLITFPGKDGSPRPAHHRFLENIEKLVRELSPNISSLDNSPYLPPDLLHIENRLFETGLKDIQSSNRPLLVEARAPADEARETLRWIKKLVLRENIPLSSCIIFTPNPSIYHPLLKAYANEFGIPIRFTQDEPLGNSPAIAALLNLLTLPVKNFNTRLLINVLRSPYFEFAMSSEIVDQLELVSRVAQIVESREQWEETWERLSQSSNQDKSDLDDERILPGLPRGSQALNLRQVLDEIFRQITPQDNLIATQSEWTNWLEDLLERLHFYEKANSERDQAACEVFRETLRAIVLSEAVAGERRGDYAQFLADLQGTLEGVGLREPQVAGEPALLVGRMVEARGIRFQTVALLGFSEGVFPANEQSDPFLDEDLRAALGLEQRLQREQAGLFYQAITRTDKYLLITRPYLSDDGEKWEESPFWKAVESLFDKSAKITIRPDDPQPLSEAASTQELLFSAVRQKSLPQKYGSLFERWTILRHAREVLKARREKFAKGPHEGIIKPVSPILEIRFSKNQTWSPSKLEYYGSCPFQFFVRTALELEPRALPKVGLDPNQLGSILHKILEETYKNISDPTNLQEVLDSLEKVSEQVFSTAPKVHGFRPSPLWDHEKVQLSDKVQKSVRAMAEDRAWASFAYELEFGKKNTPQLEINLGEETILIRGVIDRVDRNSEDQLRVVDYKTGSSHLTGNDLKDGYRLQLPIYALAVRDALKLGLPIDGIYWKILGGESGSLKLAKFKNDNIEGIDAAIEVVCKHLLRIVKGIRSAEFPPQPPHGGCPSYCPTAQWCWHFEPEWSGN